MKKYFTLVIGLLLLIGCGTEEYYTLVKKETSVSVTGNIYNKPPIIYMEDALSMTEPEHLGSISKSDFIMVSTTITNTGTEDLTDLSYTIEMEDDFNNLTGNIQFLAAGETFNTEQWWYYIVLDIRPNYIARWVVLDDEGTELESKEYLFNIVP